MYVCMYVCMYVYIQIYIYIWPAMALYEDLYMAYVQCHLKRAPDRLGSSWHAPADDRRVGWSEASSAPRPGGCIASATGEAGPK